MEREMLKAKKQYTKEWVIGYYLSYDNEHIIITVNEKGLLYERIDPDTLCHYTGFDDLKNQNVFENDILKDNQGNLYKVYWRENYFSYSCVCVKSDISSFFNAKWDLWSLANITKLEIIGNIFDNPELLGE